MEVCILGYLWSMEIGWRGKEKGKGQAKKKVEKSHRKRNPNYMNAYT